MTVMRKISITLLIILTLQPFLVAQDIKVNKQYLTAPNLINPAFTGNELCFNANLISTFQWLGMENAPRTFLLDAHKGFNPNPFEPFSKHGIGGTLYNDRNGPYSFTGIRASYAFHAYLSKTNKVRLSLGISGTGTWYSLNQKLLYRNSAAIPDNPALNYSMNNSIVPNMALGTVLYVKQAYLGFSALNLLPMHPSYESAPVTKRNYIAIAGFSTFFPEQNIQLEPIVLFHYSNSSISYFDASILATISQNVGFGLTYRHSLASIPGTPNSLAARVSLIKNHWTYTYMYDLGFNSLQFNSFGNHEISIGYKLCPGKNSKCPAY
jgi:type IX secretion system PorP/SprF family membrane protein